MYVLGDGSDRVHLSPRRYGFYIFFSELNFQTTLWSEKQAPDADVFSTGILYILDGEFCRYLKLKYWHNMR